MVLDIRYIVQCQEIMIRPTYKQFKEAMLEEERIEGTRLKPGNPMAVANPLTEEELQEMWAYIQKQPPTGLLYHGEITSLT